jgi:hypothetical protein
MKRKRPWLKEYWCDMLKTNIVKKQKFCKEKYLKCQECSKYKEVNFQRSN